MRVHACMPEARAHRASGEAERGMVNWSRVMALVWKCQCVACSHGKGNSGGAR